MTDRERLIGLLVAGMFKFSEKGIVDNTALADYILSDGWIRPPCKVGDTVWAIALTGKLYQYTINGVHQFEDKHFMFGGYRIREDGKKVNPTWQDSEIGRIVFIGATAKEEAKKARAEMADGSNG